MPKNLPLRKHIIEIIAAIITIMPELIESIPLFVSFIGLAIFFGNELYYIKKTGVVRIRGKAQKGRTAYVAYLTLIIFFYLSIIFIIISIINYFIF